MKTIKPKAILARFGGSAWRDDDQRARASELAGALSHQARKRADAVLAELKALCVAVTLEQDGKLKLRSAKRLRRDQLGTLERFGDLLTARLLEERASVTQQ